MTPDPLKFYQHRYGGIYQVIQPRAKSSIDKSEWVVYAHAYPFDTDVWIRPFEEFLDGRFKEISGPALLEAFAKDRTTFQAEIIAAKALSKG